MKRPIPNFQAFTLKHRGFARQLITEVEIFPAFDFSAPPSPLPGSVKTQALWDTGATESVITTATANSLALKATGVSNVRHGGGMELHNTHLVNFGLPNRVGISGVLVTENPHIINSFGAIIGMDIISRGDFTVTNFNGETCMTFRMPSMSSVDYVKEFNDKLRSSVSRNEPCPCGQVDGNGKPIKFKKCHGASI
ncbi:MAG TPA: hypothetical protein VGP08_00145 [Pyrinomonadaceae bacterium]|jgi:hypothetical protein|nr:hypothetical protein [Pyrinomonadaceae bacterium]